MLKVLLLFVLLIAGIVVGPMIAGHQGYVLIQTDNYNIETSVTGLAIILILAMVVLFAIEWLLLSLRASCRRTRVISTGMVSLPASSAARSRCWLARASSPRCCAASAASR